MNKTIIKELGLEEKMIIKDMKLYPLKNPNVNFINTNQDLLDKFNKSPIPILDNKTNNVIGYTMRDGYIKNECIYGSVELNKSFKNIEWVNATCTGEFIDNDKWEWVLNEYADIIISCKDCD